MDLLCLSVCLYVVTIKIRSTLTFGLIKPALHIVLGQNPSSCIYSSNPALVVDSIFIFILLGILLEIPLLHEWGGWF